MELRGEKTAWMVILGCALAIGLLLSIKAQQIPDADELTQSSIVEELSHAGAHSHPIFADPNLIKEPLVKARGSVSVISERIVKAGVDAQTARNILVRRNQAAMRKHDVIVTQEEFKNRDHLLSMKPIYEPGIIADFNPINGILQERVRALNLKLEAQRSALREIQSADGLPTQAEVEAERPPTSEGQTGKTLRIAILYTSEARRYAGGVDAVYDEIKRRMTIVTRQLQSDLGYDESTYWVARYTGSISDSETQERFRSADIIFVYSGSTNRELVPLQQ